MEVDAGLHNKWEVDPFNPVSICSAVMCCSGGYYSDTTGIVVTMPSPASSIALNIYRRVTRLGSDAAAPRDDNGA